ncbi:MAG: sugar phosphate isomerase/epimerase [Lentisphaerae bacterium]|nr:sugar phosphate isomerase/epimerase [Lentisphaerota bacterium]
MSKPVVGAQIYTVREFAKTAADLAATLVKIRRIGYTEIQLSGVGPIPVPEVARIVKGSGLKAVATHIRWDRFLQELDAVIEEHKLLECPHPAIGSLPGEYLCEDGVKRFVDELRPVAEKLRAAGMDFSYHNHNQEFARFGGKTWLAALYDTAPADVLKAELDTYWVQAGGGDPAAWVLRCAGREPLLHLKDMAIVGNREQRFAEIGEGNMNWPAILSAADGSGVRHILVEQDQCYGRDPFESLAVSYRNLSFWGYK